MEVSRFLQINLNLESTPFKTKFFSPHFKPDISRKDRSTKMAINTKSKIQSNAKIKHRT